MTQEFIRIYVCLHHLISHIYCAKHADVMHLIFIFTFKILKIICFFNYASDMKDLLNFVSIYGIVIGLK